MTNFFQINVDKIVDYAGYCSMGGMFGYRVAECVEDVYRVVSRVPKNLPYKIPNLSPKALGVMGALAFPLIAKDAYPSVKNILSGNYGKKDIVLVAGALFTAINLATLPFQKKSPILQGIKTFCLIGGWALDGYGIITAENKTDFWTQAGMLALFNFDRQTRQSISHFISSNLNSDFALKMAYASSLLLAPSIAFGATGGDPTTLPTTLAATAAVTTLASRPYRRFVELMKEINLYEMAEITCFPHLRTLLRRAVKIIHRPNVSEARKLIRDADEELITLAKTKFTPQLQELLAASKHQRSRMDEWTTAWHGRNSANRLISRAKSLGETLEFLKPRGLDPLLSPEIKALTAARVRLFQYQEQAEGLLVIERDLDTLPRRHLPKEELQRAYQAITTRLERVRASDFSGVRTQADLLHRQLPPLPEALPAAPQRTSKPRLVPPPLPQIELESLGPRDYLIAEAMALGTNGSTERFLTRLYDWDVGDIDLARKIYGGLTGRSRVRFINLFGADAGDLPDSEAVFIVRTVGTHLDIIHNPSGLISNYEGSLRSNHHQTTGPRFELEVLDTLAQNPVVRLIGARHIYHSGLQQCEVDQHFRVDLGTTRTIDFFSENKAGLLFDSSDLKKQLARLAYVAKRHRAALILVTQREIPVLSSLLTPHQITQLNSIQLATMTPGDFEKIWQRFYASA